MTHFRNFRKLIVPLGSRDIKTEIIFRITSKSYISKFSVKIKFAVAIASKTPYLSFQKKTKN